MEILKCHRCRQLLLKEFLDEEGYCERCFLLINNLKRCGKCYKVKSLDLFRKLHKGKEIRSICLECEKIYYYKSARDKRKKEEG